MNLGDQLAAAARSYVGTPFKHKGRKPGVGLDCVGVPICAARECGLVVPDVWNYGTHPDPDNLLRAIGIAATEVQPADAKSGDLFLFWFREHAKPSHFAVWDGADAIVHAFELAGKVMVHQFNRAWQSRMHSCWRMLGVTHG